MGGLCCPDCLSKIGTLRGKDGISVGSDSRPHQLPALRQAQEHLGHISASLQSEARFSLSFSKESHHSPVEVVAFEGEKGVW